MKLIKKIAASLLVAGTLFAVAGCKTQEDVYDIIQTKTGGATASFTNDKDVKYARAFVTTNLKHLSGDMKITIDTKKSKGAYSAGYIFNLAGKGTSADPYSFCLIGVRYNNGKAQYFASYYENVLSEDTSSDNNDFDTKNNNAYEYALKSWTNIPDVTIADDGKLVVYLDVKAKYNNTVINTEEKANTNINASDSSKGTYAENANGFEVNLKDATNTKTYTTVTFDVTEINKSANDGDKSGQTIKEFDATQKPYGYYAMVSKDAHLEAEWDKGTVEILSADVVEE